MSLELLHWLIALYVAGVFIGSFGSIQFIFQRNQLKKNMGLDLFTTRPDMKAYLILKPIFWPYFFVTQRSPLERLSELLFKHYGDKGYTYLGDHGIKNFYNDVVKGKNRYKNYQANRIIWPVDKNSGEYQEYRECFNDNGKPVYAEIIYARHQDKYLLRVIWGKKELLGDEKGISRFQLDQCEPMNAEQFQRRLLQINCTRATELLQQFQ